MKKIHSQLDPVRIHLVRGAVAAPAPLLTLPITDDGDDLGDRERSTKRPRP